jgi:hypothetical protein
MAGYVPRAYNCANIYLTQERIRRSNITSGEAMKYAITGGVVDLAEGENRK